MRKALRRQVNSPFGSKKIMNVNWVGSISEEIEEQPGKSFSKERLRNQSSLFAHRAALYFTSTENIPSEYVGTRALNIDIPIPTPDYTDLWELNSYKSPKLWVDLIQRQTYKIRWLPMIPATIIITRFDAWKIRQDHTSLGIKSLVDALKVKTTGRKDRKYLHYFGAIVDDGPEYIDLQVKQDPVNHPKDAFVRLQVQPNNEPLAEV